MFQGKSVLVLGGSRGIGAAIVRRFADEGAKVTFTYGASQGAAEELAKETGSTAIRADSADRDEVIRVVRDSGPLDILIVNSGIAIFGDALDQDPDAIDRLFQINIQTPYHASVEAARQMPDGGRIIVIGSVNGDRMPVPGMASTPFPNRPCRGWRGFGTRLRAARHHHQRCAARPDRHRREPGKRADERPDAQLHGTQAPWTAGGSGRHGGSAFRA